ncbi:MAG: GDP-mannose 4,6-dehydratase [Verrucomicrobia bacterium]|nr:GDP-mannose 4,6-dehydratase [Verrucomicrobiota bacterium]
MKRTLISGAAGMMGSHLAAYLSSQGDAVVATSSGSTIDPAVAAVCERVLPLDVRDASAVLKVITDTKPDRIVHLAAISIPQVSWARPADTFAVNVLGTVNVLEAARAAVPAARIITVSSSAIYAETPQGRPIREDDALWPSSPYAASKIVVDQTSWLFAKRYGLAVMRVRPFFVIGPRKRGDVSSDFARGIVRVERGLAPALSVGSLHPVREFVDVRDSSRALAMILDRGTGGEAYNICCGAPTAIDELLERLRSLATVSIAVEADPARQRPLEEDVKVGDPTRLKALGWQPDVSLDACLSHILDYWRAQPDGDL